MSFVLNHPERFAGQPDYCFEVNVNESSYHQQQRTNNAPYDTPADNDSVILDDSGEEPDVRRGTPLILVAFYFRKSKCRCVRTTDESPMTRLALLPEARPVSR